MHYTNGGKHTEGHDTTDIVAEVTCGNCKRTKAFHAAEDAALAAVVTRGLTHELAGAGFVINHSHHNYALNRDFYITAVDRFGIRAVVQGIPDALYWGDLAFFLMWLTPQDVNVNRVIKNVTESGMTWVEAMDAEWSLTADFNDRSVGDRIVSGGDSGTIVAVRGSETMVKFDKPIKGLGTTVRITRPEALTFVAEDVDQSVKPFRTAGKVKNTRQARRYRKGA